MVNHLPHGPLGFHKSSRLSKEHIKAVNRDRRIVVNFDVMIVDPVPGEDPYKLAKERFTFTDDVTTVIDSIWWNWGEGNVVPYPSKYLPQYDHPGFKKWLEDDVDIVRIFLDETRNRGKEVFYSHRMNGSDNDPRYVPGVGVIMDGQVQSSEDKSSSGNQFHPYTIPAKEEHPDWLFHLPWGENGYWDFSVEGSRDYVVRNLREVAENYDFDGIELDFARGVAAPEGKGWPNRNHLTDLMRQIRSMTLEIEKNRGRPFLLAARIPENIIGCHFDGIDVESWVSEELIDIFTLGCRSFEVDIAAFRRIIKGTSIKIYPALDDHHSTDGYCTPPVEVFRGVFSNWYRQGADGIQTFNWSYQPDVWGSWSSEPWWRLHLQSYQEMGDPESLKFLDKTFVIQRRGGGHGPSVVPDTEDWSTPRYWYGNSNMLAQLPVPLANDCKVDTILNVYIGDDVNSNDMFSSEVNLRLLLHDPEEGNYLKCSATSSPENEAEHQIQRAVIRDWFIPKRIGKEDQLFLYNSPPAKGIDHQIEVRVNNVLLNSPSIEGGWLVFQVDANCLAIGDNLVGIRLTDRKENAIKNMMVEKLEVQVRYR